MAGEMKRERRTFFFSRQEGICCLMRTVECIKVSGQMSADLKRTPRRATWDHILPKCHGGIIPHNTLLACKECNEDRSAQPAPDGLAEKADLLWREWLAHAGIAITAPTRKLTQAALKKLDAGKQRALPRGVSMEDYGHWVIDDADERRRIRNLQSQAAAARGIAKTAAEAGNKERAAIERGKVTALERAIELGVTDPLYLPCAKRA